MARAILSACFPGWPVHTLNFSEEMSTRGAVIRLAFSPCGTCRETLLLSMTQVL